MLEDFRVAGATNPDVVIDLPSPSRLATRRAERLMQAGVLRTGDRGYWLDERAYAGYAGRRRRIKVAAILALVILMLGIVLLTGVAGPGSGQLR